MFNSIMVLSIVYACAVGFFMSIGCLYLLHSIKCTIRNTDFYAGHRGRLRAACHAVTASLCTASSRAIAASGQGVSYMVEQVYQFVYEGKKYHYTYRGEDKRGDEVTLYFLSNPRTACLEEDLVPPPRPWTKHVIPLAIIISAVLFFYFYHYMEVVSVR